MDEINKKKISNKIPIMDDFDGTLKLLHESTHDKEIRKALLIVQDYKSSYLDKIKDSPLY